MPENQAEPLRVLVEKAVANVCSGGGGMDRTSLRTSLQRFFCDDPQTAVLHLAEYLRNLPTVFQQLNCLFECRGVHVALAQRSPIVCFVLKTKGDSRIMCLDPLRSSYSSFQGFSTTRLCSVLSSGTKKDAEDALYTVTSPELRDCLAELALDVLDKQETSADCRRIVLRFLRRCHGIPPSLFLRGLKQGPEFCLTMLSDLYTGTWGGVPVVIKKPRLRKDPLNSFEIMREVTLHRQCRHPHILAFLGVSEEYNRFYGLVTPYMKHGNIVQFLRQYPDCNRLAPVWQIMQGLAYLHSFDPPIAHRDVKGTNVLVDDGLNCRLADLGLSSIPELSQRSHEEAIGTPAWMAPEILFPPEHGRVDLIKVDMFALGVTTFEVVEGKPPVKDLRLGAVISARIKGEVCSSFSRAFPPFLRQLVKDMCHNDASRRPDISLAIHKFESRLIFPRQMVLLGKKSPHRIPLEQLNSLPSKIPRYKPKRSDRTGQCHQAQDIKNSESWPPRLLTTLCPSSSRSTPPAKPWNTLSTPPSTPRPSLAQITLFRRRNPGP